MANFLPFKDSVRRSDISCKGARPPLRKCAEGFLSNLLTSTRENFSLSGNSLSASPPKQTPFLRLNNSGATETGYQQFGCSLPSHVKSTTMTATANQMEGCDAFNIKQVFEGIKGCYHNLINRDWSKTSMPSASCNSFLSTSPANCCERCMSDKNWQSQLSFDNMCKCTGCSASYQELNRYLNDYVTDMDVNKQLIMDLIGDSFSDCDKPTRMSKCVVTEQPLENSVVFRQASDSATMQHAKSGTDCHMDEIGLENNMENCGAAAESAMSHEFLAQTMQQRKHKESKKAARRRKRNRRSGGKLATSCSVTSTTKQFLGNGCVFSTSSLVSGFPSLFLSTDSGYSTQTSLFSDEDDDDPSCSIVFSDFSPSVPYLSVDSKLRQRLPDMPAHDSTSCLWDDDDDLVTVSLRSHDDEDDSTCSVSDEIRQANKKWKACYDDCADSGHWSDGDCSEARVSFASDALLVTEHDLDDEEEVRKGPWEELARDRQRFQRRIAETAKALEPILCPAHRAKVVMCPMHNTALESF